MPIQGFWFHFGLCLTRCEEGILENVRDADSENDILAAASLEAISTFEGLLLFEPAELNGETVRVQKTVRVRYRLE